MPRRSGYKQEVPGTRVPNAGAIAALLLVSAWTTAASAQQLEAPGPAPVASEVAAETDKRLPEEAAPPSPPAPAEDAAQESDAAAADAAEAEAEAGADAAKAAVTDRETGDGEQSAGVVQEDGVSRADEGPVEEERSPATSSAPYEGLDQEGSPPPPPQEAELPEEEWDDDYDGRPEPTRGEDVLIWIPRAPLYPLHLVLNYGVRAPIVGGVTLAEKHKVFQRVENWFTFADGKAGLYPVAFYDAGRGFWGGLNFFYNDLGRVGHSLRATAGIGSNDWILARIKDRWSVFDGGRGELTFSATFHRNPTFAYSGIGPRTSIEDQRFFREEKIEGAIDLRVALQNLNRFTLHVDFKRAKLGSGRDPSITADDSPHSTDELTGFDEHFELARFGMKLDLDTRAPRNIFVPGSGLRVESWGAYSYGPGSTRLSFFRYGTHPQLMWDITGANHVLSFGLYTEAVSRTGGEELPLNELVALGGSEQLRGFLPGRFRGQSALVYSLDYSWPLLAFADAILFSEVGNAYDGFFEDFAHETMALDWGTGLRSSFSRELSVWFAIGFGTNQFDRWEPDGFRVDKTRVFVGATQRL